MKTPMQELFSYLKEHNMTNVLSENQKKEWLEKEEQHLLKAFDTGESFGISATEYKDGNNYFNQTYNQ